MTIEEILKKYTYKYGRYLEKGKRIFKANHLSHPRNIGFIFPESEGGMKFWLHKCHRKCHSVYPMEDGSGLLVVCECGVNKKFGSKILDEELIDAITKVPNVLRIRDIEKI